MVIEIVDIAFRKKKEIILIEKRERWYKKQGREASRNILRGAGMSKILVGTCLKGGHNLPLPQFAIGLIYMLKIGTHIPICSGGPNPYNIGEWWSEHAWK